MCIRDRLPTDQDVEQVEKQTQCPIVTVRINNCDIKLLVDTGSHMSILNSAWIQRNKKYF